MRILLLMSVLAVALSPWTQKQHDDFSAYVEQMLGHADYFRAVAERQPNDDATYWKTMTLSDIAEDVSDNLHEAETLRLIFGQVSRADQTRIKSLVRPRLRFLSAHVDWQITITRATYASFSANYRDLADRGQEMVKDMEKVKADLDAREKLLDKLPQADKR